MRGIKTGLDGLVEGESHGSLAVGQVVVQLGVLLERLASQRAMFVRYGREVSDRIHRGGRFHAKVSLDDVDSGIHNDPEFIKITTAQRDTVREVNIHELQKRLNDAMMKLSEDHRTVVTLYDIQGLQHNEISKMFGVSEGTVRSRLFYAHRLLQTHLEDLVK